MSLLPDSKELTKLVKLCRKLGIDSFKTTEFEFTLTNTQAPTYSRRRRKGSKVQVLSDTTEDKIDNTPEEIPTNTLTEEEMMYWSVAPGGQES